MDPEGVSLPLIHEHLLRPWNDLRKGDCCGRLESISDGLYCKSCDFFIHKKCSESSTFIVRPSHFHTLKLQSEKGHFCSLCGRSIVNLFYRCETCKFDMDLFCAKYPPPKVIDISEMHRHKLTLIKELIQFDCDAECGKVGEGFPYKCHECDSSFHMDCIWYPPEVNHTYHPLHPLKLYTGQPPDYSDGKCRFCGREIDDKLFYHCVLCNFTLDMRCVLNPPRKSLMDLKVHEHPLTHLPRLVSFKCNACGLSGDQSPYICVQCDFMIHQDCFGFPRVININRHDHRISFTYVLGIVNSVCGVCRKKVDWTCGGYSCSKCPAYVVHFKCATRNDVWDGKELEETPEETEDIEPYIILYDCTIQHFSHREHNLRLHVNEVLCEENKRCRACTHPICLQSFYGCMDCDFILHQTCAEFPKLIKHVLYSDQLVLITNEADVFECGACHRMSNGFRYQLGADKLDVLCGTIAQPFNHPSHDHPLYYIPQDERRHCNGCNEFISHAFKCMESECIFQLDFKCATLPSVVKHSIDEDHPFSLCYGKQTSGKHWCEICGKETNLNTWFYTCKDQGDSLHTSCVVRDFSGLMPRTTIEVFSRSFEVVLNNGVCRPFCRGCKSRCMYPIMLKMLGTSDTYYICSNVCLNSVLEPIKGVGKEIQNPNMQESM